MKKLMMAAALLTAAVAAQAESGMAKMKGTAENSPIAGTVKLSDSGEGLKMMVQLTGVPAGEHGLHIHEFGSCDDLGKAAGGHYNPNKAPHGQVLKSGIKKSH